MPQLSAPSFLPQLTGMRAVWLVWLGQFVSVLATMMSQFALTIWIFEKTGSVLALGTLQVFTFTPMLLALPFAGALIDRYDRKWMMAVSDAVAGVGTIGLLVLQASGHLELWHLYVASALFGLGQAFQEPAYAAVLTQMVEKKDLARANGLMSLKQSGPGLLAPLLAGFLLPVVGLGGILLFDVVTFGLALAVLALVAIPPLAKKSAPAPLWQDAVFGLRYIWARPGLLGLQLVFFFGIFFMGLVTNTTIPLMLTRTANNTMVVGTVRTLAALGGIVGGVVMSAWGGLTRRIHGVLLGWALASVFFMLYAVPVGEAANPGLQILWWGSLVGSWRMLAPLVNSSTQAIWQAKVPPELQGRVFATRIFIAWFTNPIAPVLAGAMGDYVLEPLAQHPPLWFQSLSPLIGTGAGSGLALLILVSGAGGVVSALAAYAFPAVRNVEAE